ncbi:MAG: permease-like cell division protein FtsX [Bacteroidales bacterium]|nr:permease-like cell division protein FtsX [Bacteroidales bacterium]
MGSWISTVISISLVLLLVGIAALLLVNARSVSDYFKENMQVSVLMTPDVDEEAAAKFQAELDARPFVKETSLVTREQGTREMAEMLGPDFLSVFESSPIPVSIDVTLKADYVSTDSLAMVKDLVSASPLVDEVVYQQSLVEKLNANLKRISLVLGVFILLLLFISFVLINNTVRLDVYSKRFTIHTMRLVGATKAFIRRPFLWKSVIQGVVAALLATLMMALIIYFLKKEFVQVTEVFPPESLAMVTAVMLVAGIVICLVSTFFVVGRLVSLSRNELYY